MVRILGSSFDTDLGEVDLNHFSLVQEFVHEPFLCSGVTLSPKPQHHPRTKLPEPLTPKQNLNP